MEELRAFTLEELKAFSDAAREEGRIAGLREAAEVCGRGMAQTYEQQYHYSWCRANILALAGAKK